MSKGEASQKVRIIFQDSFHFIDNKRRQSLHTYYIQPSWHPDVKAELALKVPGEEVKSHPFTTKLSGYSSYRESEKDLLLDIMFLQLW